MKEEVKAGVIIVASFLILSSFVILIGGSQLFEKSDKYYVRVMNAAGLESGALVKLGGVRVGRVLGIREPKEPGKPIVIEIGVRQGTPIYRGTKAMITQIGFVGDIYLLLSVDNTTEGRLNIGDDIPSETTADFGRIMTKLDVLSESVDGMIKDIDRLFSEKNVKKIETLVDNTNTMMVTGASNIEKVAVVIKATSDKLEIVLNEIEDLMKTNKGNLAGLIAKAREDLEKAGEMIKTIEAAAKTVDKTSGSVEKAVNINSQNIANLINAMTRTTEEIQEVVQEIKNKPWSIVYQEGKEE